jgi:hypothetical protein
MKQERLAKIVKEEVDNMLKESQKNHDKIAKKLEELRTKLFKEGLTKENLGTEKFSKEKRMQLNLVSEIVDVPVNELMLHFLNCVKASNGRHLVEYRMGQCYFYEN